MTTSQSIIVELIPQSQRIITQIENVVVREIVLTMKPASLGSSGQAHVNYQQLPFPTVDYISLREAIEYSGLTEETLIQLIDERKIQAIDVQNAWLILKDSLAPYVKKQ